MSINNIKKNKQKIRTEFINERHKLSALQQQNRSAKVVSNLNQLLARLNLISNTTRIALYNAINKEVDLFQGFNCQRDNIYFPKVNPLRKGEMVFTQIDEITKTISSYGIVESATMDGHILANKLDVIIIPLVAFDESGTRLGYGGGYYDMALSVIKKPATNSAVKHPVLIGVAYDFQQHPQLPCEAHDIKLHYVVTDAAIIDISS